MIIQRTEMSNRIRLMRGREKEKKSKDAKRSEDFTIFWIVIGPHYHKRERDTVI